MFAGPSSRRPFFVEEVVRRSVGGSRAALTAQEVEQTISGDRPLGADRGPDEVLLEVEELELRGLPDQLGGLLRIGDAGELDDDLVVALLADLGLGDAELVDAVPHDVHRAIEVLVGERVALGRNGFQHHLEPALEIEAERRTLVER